MAILAPDKMLLNLKGSFCPNCSAWWQAPLPYSELFRRGTKKRSGRATVLKGRPVYASSSEDSLQEQLATLRCTAAGLAVTQAQALLAINDNSEREKSSQVDQCTGGRRGGARGDHNLRHLVFLGRHRGGSGRTAQSLVAGCGGQRVGEL